MTTGMGAFFHEPLRVVSTGGGKPSLVEDTLPALGVARGMGAHACRTNAASTADGSIVIFSDAVAESGFLDRRALSSLTVGDLRREYAAARVAHGCMLRVEELFPSLAEALVDAKQHRFIINIADSHPSSAAAVCRVVAQAGAGERVLFTALNSAVMRMAGEVCPAASRALPFSKVVALYALYRIGFFFVKKNVTADALVVPEAIGISHFASRPFIDELHRRGVPTLVMGVRDAAQIKRLYEAGADAFITGDISLVQGFLQGRDGQ